MTSPHDTTDARSTAGRLSVHARYLFALALCLAAGQSAHAQPGHAPLLFVRFVAPSGAKITFYPGGSAPRLFTTPVTAGLRPGYLYRVKITNIPGRPGLALYPTLEVRNTLKLPPIIRASDHPAPIPIHPEDIDRVMAGALITKVVYLEHPDRAVAASVPADRPIEAAIPHGRDPLVEARELGRPVLILRFGERELYEEELMCQAVAGTLLLPEDKGLPPPRLPPCIPFGCLAIEDPVLAPKHAEEECLHDGGDCDRPAGFDRNGQVQGVDPSDTVAAYSDSRGRRRLTMSNRVCLCVPRFGILRSELALLAYHSVVPSLDRTIVAGQAGIEARLPSLLAQQNDQPAAMQGRLRPTGTVTTESPHRFERLVVLNAYHVDLGIAEAIGSKRLHRLTLEERTRLVRQIEFARLFDQIIGTRVIEQLQAGPAVVGQLKGVRVVANVEEVRDFTVCCNEAPRAPDQPLRLYKWASTHTAKIGDVVTFFLKYSNLGGQPITDVAVSDSLTGRLEYVPGSARSNRDAVFSTEENRAGSLLLHWEIMGRLLPGDHGVVTFQARIR